MRKVAVSSWATSTFTKGSKMSLFELACEPSVQLIRRNGLSAKEIDAVLFSSCATDQYSSAIISEMLGIHPKITYRIDNLCNSGTNAVTSAFAIIACVLCASAHGVAAGQIGSPSDKWWWHS